MTIRTSFRAWNWLLASALLYVPVSHAADLFDETKVTTLFGFDTVSIPHTQNLRIEMRQPKKHPANPVVKRGAPGTPDAQGVQFYGSIIKEGAKYRMWYVAFDDDKENSEASNRWRAAYAESTDGLNWTKPNLGLVEYKGNKNNNLLDMGGGPWGFVNVKVLKDDADPDASRRYKMTSHIYFRHQTRLGNLLPFVSADGLTWKPVKDVKSVKSELLMKDVLLPAIHFEPSGGLYQWDGMFYASGQNSMNSTRPYHGRVTRMYRSADFVNWSQTNTLGFVRHFQHTLLGPGRSREGEQTHEGISVWNRGNVLLGVSGIWHGAKEWKDLTIDLGFMISNDGNQFREPAHEWVFIPRGKDGEWDQGGVIQAQGFENIGEETFIYYGTWDPRHWQDAPPRGGVGIVAVPRDRLGDLVVETAGKGPGDYQLPEIVSEFVTAALTVKKPKFFLNAEGLGEKATLKVELLDHVERPLPGYSGKNAVVISQNGFQTPVEWKSTEALPERMKLHVVFEGEKNTDIRLSAIYVRDGK
ncbi:hypothetical protein [Brevifollis gellanilyticus]|uniref:Glycosyl hydrolase family 32 N-terminal domain-containing protein n=1 Tax=Brevifollis gellanilyticus TaxID=748831 RepID=A0A512M777_9BACT|nr:hypothetical protein [Brevifollis gellanilyticus]GEP42587.1 hypothetical protein BGE01nite_18780 [Brevifollis gellanilyticus]